MKEPRKGLLVEIMGKDCTNNGATSGKSMAILIIKGCEVFFETENYPALKIIPGRGSRKYIAVPADTPEGVYPMFGGHFIYSSDSRFIYNNPIHVHDRFES
jgi:hypothetical protein